MPYQIDGCGRSLTLYHLQLSGLNERHEARVQFPEDRPQFLRGLIDQLPQRTFAVSVYLVINCEDTFDHAQSEPLDYNCIFLWRRRQRGGMTSSLRGPKSSWK